MNKIVIYGVSDDLIEVDGNVQGCDEYYSGTQKGTVVCLPTEDRFTVNYGARGVWEVAHEHVSGKLQVEITKAPPEDDPDPYTDTATVTGDIQRVEFWKLWKSWPPSTREIRERMETHLEDFHRWDDETVRRVWEALGRP